MRLFEIQWPNNGEATLWALLTLIWFVLVFLLLWECYRRDVPALNGVKYKSNILVGSLLSTRMPYDVSKVGQPQITSVS